MNRISLLEYKAWKKRWVYLKLNFQSIIIKRKHSEQLRTTVFFYDTFHLNALYVRFKNTEYWLDSCLINCIETMLFKKQKKIDKIYSIKV